MEQVHLPRSIWNFWFWLILPACPAFPGSPVAFPPLFYCSQHVFSQPASCPQSISSPTIAMVFLLSMNLPSCLRHPLSNLLVLVSFLAAAHLLTRAFVDALPLDFHALHTRFPLPHHRCLFHSPALMLVDNTCLSNFNPVLLSDWASSCTHPCQSLTLSLPTSTFSSILHCSLFGLCCCSPVDLDFQLSFLSLHPCIIALHWSVMTWESLVPHLSLLS